MGTDADIVRRLSDEVIIGGNVGALDELMADSFVSHDPPPGLPGTRDGFRTLAELVAGAFSDRKLDFDEYVDTADGRVVENWVMIATHTGEAFGLPASGREVRVRGIKLWRCADGRIVEHWGAVDMSDVVAKAMGATP